MKCHHTLDTETTGLGSDAELCEMAVVDHRGNVVLNTLVKPLRSIPAAATAIHGIRDEEVASAPSLPEILEGAQGRFILSGQTRLGIYNADYDLRLMRQSLLVHERNDLLDLVERVSARADCVMQLYAQFYRGVEFSIRLV